MAIQPYMSSQDYIDALKKNQAMISNIGVAARGILYHDKSPERRNLISKTDKELDDNDRRILDLNPEMYAYRVQLNELQKQRKELEKHNKTLKKEYEAFVSETFSQGLGTAQPSAGNTIEEAIGGTPSAGTGNTIEQAIGGGASNTIEEGLAGQAPGVTSATGGSAGGSWEQPFNQAISTLRGTERQVRSSADEQLHGAGIAANREAGYLKGLATRTGSSFGEAKLADDRASAVFNEQAANIRAQRDAHLGTIGQNIAGVQQQLGSTRAQMYDSELARRAAAAAGARSSSPNLSDLELLIQEMQKGKGAEGSGITDEDLENIKKK